MSAENPSPTPVSTAQPGCLRRGLAILLSLLFIVVAVSSLLAFNLWRVLFNPRLIKEALTREVLASELVPATLEMISEWRAGQRIRNQEALSGVNEPDIVLLMSFLKADDWRAIRKELISDDFIANLISVSVDGFYQWLDGAQPWPQIRWDLQPLKDSLVGEAGKAAILVAYGALPPCTEVEITDFQNRLAKAPPGVAVLYNLCQFPDPWHQDQVDDYVEALHGVNQNVPAIFDTGEQLSQNPPQLDPLRLKGQLRLLRALGQWGWLGALLLLGLSAALVVRSRVTAGQYLGLPLLISGLLAAGLALLGSNLIAQALSGLLPAFASPFARQAVGDSLRSLTGLIFQPMLIQSVILAVLGALLVALIFWKPGRQPEPGAVEAS